MTQEAAVPDSFKKQILRWIDERVAKAMRSAPLRNASIGDGGSLTLRGGTFRAKYPEAEGGETAVSIGPQHHPTSGGYLGTGLLVQAPDGTDMIVARQDAQFDNTRVDIYDSGNRIIFGNDASSGLGLARPYLDSQPRLSRYVDWPTFTLATIDVWETVYEYSHTKQHPRLEVAVMASMDTAATTGELRVMVDGVQLGSTSSIAYAFGPSYFGPANVAGLHMAVLEVEIQVRRTTATGGMKLAPMYCRGRQSP